MKRRQLLLSSLLGVGGLFAGCLDSGGDGGSQQTTQLTESRSQGDQVTSSAVNNSTMESSERVYSVRDQVQSRYGNLQGVVLIGIAPAKRNSTDANSQIVSVGVEPGQVEHVRSKIPSRLNGIRIKVYEEQANPT